MINAYFESQIKENFRLQPTLEQEKALKSLSSYLFSSWERCVFLLKGYAGTGKTSLIGALVKALVQFKQPVILLAPTGRAAKVFSQYAEHPAYTIHRCIYREKTVNDISSVFTLNYNKYKHAIFIVDEASMIANGGISDNVFGSGRLLEDMIDFIYSGEGNRLIVLGDLAQLPPIGDKISHALVDATYINLGLDVISEELTQVVRQSKDSGILSNATLIRDLLNNGNGQFPKVKVRGFGDVNLLSSEEFIESITSSYDKVGIDETMVICRSNRQTKIYNNGIRSMVLGFEDELTSGDRIMIVKNNYYWTEGIKEIGFIANGDIAYVRRVRKCRELYGFRFADVTLEFPDYDDYELDVTVLLDTLQSEAPSLTKGQQEELFNRISEDYLNESKKEIYKSLRTNPYFNALQIKYAYAVTCHKSQGGQWAHVYLDQGYISERIFATDYFHWLYTAFTRATEKLYLVNWPENLLE